MDASVLSKSLFDPMMRTSRSATSTLWGQGTEITEKWFEKP
jgi:hypothetical protein